MRALAALLVLACGDAPMPGAQAPLPQVMTLRAPPIVHPGEAVPFELTGGQPNATILFAVSNGDIGPGPCPPFLGGDCFDITAGTTGVSPLARARTDGTGQARLLPTVPIQGAPVDTFVVQAVDTTTGIASNPVRVGLACPDNAAPPAVRPCPVECTGGCTPDSCLIDCGAPGACSTIVTCPPGENCDIVCAGPDACQTVIVVCPSPGRCDIECIGPNACQAIDVLGGDGETTIRCSGPDTCIDGQVICGFAGCHTVCNGPGAELRLIAPGRGCLHVDEGCL